MREENKLQGSGTWWADRLGKLTGSRMASAMAFLKSGKEASERETLRYEIVAERISNTFADKYTTDSMQWGVDMEPAAKEAFEARTGLKVSDVGFVDHPTIDHCGCSPDGFTSDGCAIEVKCPRTKTHLKYVQAGGVPEEYKPQMILQAACTGRDIWFVSYDPRLPEAQSLFIRKFSPTAEEIKQIEDAAQQFLDECEKLFTFFTKEANYTGE